MLQVKTKLQITTSLLCTNHDKGLLQIRCTTALKITYYEPGVDPAGGLVQLYDGWVDNERININWDVSPVSSPVTVLSHRGEFNRGNDHWPTPLFHLDLFQVPPVTPEVSLGFLH